MWPDVVVMRSPASNRCTGAVEVGKPVQIQAELAELAVEAFNESVLSGLPGLDEVELGADSLRPEEHHLAGQLGAVVHQEP